MLSNLAAETVRDLNSKYTIIKNSRGEDSSLGEGSFGLVIKGEEKSTGKKVAIKKIKRTTDKTYLLREISLLRILKGQPDIISLEFIAMSDKEFYLVFERFDTDLNKIIGGKYTLTPDHIQSFSYQILRGIHALHLRKLAHRDLKPANILVNIDCKIKICDFGLSRATHAKQQDSTSVNSASLFHQLTPYVVTRWYRSPELLLSSQGAGAPPADMWSIGCILAELLLRKPLFPSSSYLDALEVIFNLMGTPDPNDCEWINEPKARRYINRLPAQSGLNFQQKFIDTSSFASDLLKKLLVLNPEKRITAEQALQHPWFNGSFDHKNILPCSSPDSIEDRNSLHDYYEFESKLDREKDKYLPHVSQKAEQLILKEIARYTPKSTPVSTTVPTPVPAAATTSPPVMASTPILGSTPFPPAPPSSPVTRSTPSSVINPSSFFYAVTARLVNQRGLKEEANDSKKVDPVICGDKKNTR